MVSVCAVSVILAYFVISPVLASLLPLGHGIWAILITAPSFFPSPVSSSLPMDNGVPRAIKVINLMMGTENYDEITREIGGVIKRWGFTELKEYCELDHPRQNYGNECDKLNEIYRFRYGGRHFDYTYNWPAQHFSSYSIAAGFDVSLIKISKYIPEGRDAVTDNLDKILLENGLEELQQYCKHEEKRENKAACNLVGSMKVILVRQAGYRYSAPGYNGPASAQVENSNSKFKDRIKKLIPKFNKHSGGGGGGGGGSSYSTGMSTTYAATTVLNL